ncbi:Na/Pi cotransporter family protein [Puteibacter caeruleilacunae]|nr:Na/Pi cotransporter family protein [Puteibacter caeruleilacunae]
MDYSFWDFLTLVGALGMFLYGMKLMSESLQKVAGQRMRSILASMTSNRFKGVLTGVLITTLVQSSSATTVMVVSFVNAGLLSLFQSIGVIMGANIGTTVTAWMISILGFKVSISSLSLPLIGLSLPILFSKNRTRKFWAEMVMGFALLFIGLDFLKGAVPDISHNHEILEFLKEYSSMGFGSYLLFLGIGTVLTVVIQSSSATMALTLIMCNSGWIGFDVAAAMVLGENIGTTITANIAAMVANSSAKRAARAHLIFNLFGVMWVMLIFPFYLGLVTWLNGEFGGQDPHTSVTAIPVALSIFHSTFNILNTIVLIGFAGFIAKVVERIVPNAENDDEFRLTHINTGMLSTPDASIYQARQEVIVFAEKVMKMFRQVQSLKDEQKDKNFAKKLAKIQRHEEWCDRIELEIAGYLMKVGENRLTDKNSRRLRALYKMIDDIESMADSCLKLAMAFNRRREEKIEFPGEVENNLNIIVGLTEESLNIMNVNLKMEDNITIETAEKKEEEINNFRDILKQEHLNNIETGIYGYQTGILYNDIFSECEKLGDYVINVSQALKAIND